MSILEDNKPIFNWMGGKCEVDGKGVPYTSRTPNYHSDWNQLMEAVEKIEGDGYEVEIWGNNCKISHPETSFNLWRDAETKIQAVYQAVLEYIKQQKEG